MKLTTTTNVSADGVMQGLGAAQKAACAADLVSSHQQTP